LSYDFSCRLGEIGTAGGSYRSRTGGEGRVGKLREV